MTIQNSLLRILGWAMLSGVGVISTTSIVGLLLQKKTFVHWNMEYPGISMPASLGLLFLTVAISCFAIANKKT